MHELTDRDALLKLAAELRDVAEASGARPAELPDLEPPSSTDEAVREVAWAAHLLAERAARDRRLLAENIESLDRTNRELRAARDQVIRSARLASVGTLAAGIAHEVGNPLGAIVGFVDVALKRAERDGQDTELLDAIRTEASRIDRIVRGLLDYARPPSGPEESRSASEIVRNVRALLENQGKLAAVETTWELGPGDESRLVAPQRLEQVLVNLLLNGVFAVRDRPDPHISVVLRTAEGSLRRMPARREDDPPELNYLHRRREALDERGPASVATSERMLVIEVSDNGPGIPPEDRERVFDPFFTTKDPGDGTGLGLSICARLIESMGGMIDAEESEWGGARFLIRLPMTYDEAEGAGHRTTETE